MSLPLTDFQEPASVFNRAGIKLFHQDILEGISNLPRNSVDLAIVDPPYGASSKTPAQLPSNHGLSGFGGAWKAADHKWDLLDPKEHLNFVLSWLEPLTSAVKPEGSIFIHGSYHNLGFANVACQMLGIEIINEIVWFKRNAMPNLRGTRLTASHESILWVHTGGKKRNYRFNYELSKSKDYPGDEIKKPGKQMRTVWDIPNNKTKSELAFGSHPTQKPERLIQRLLDIAAPESGLLLSPFLGSGTDLVVGVRNGLQGIGFEIDDNYIDLAVKRISHEIDLKESLLPMDGN